MDIAIILYTVRDAAEQDLPGTLRRVRDAGFEYVQWSGMPELPALEICELLDDAGLTAIAGHYPAEPFEESYAAALKHWKRIGVKDVAPGMMMEECRDRLEKWLEGAERLESIGKQLREDGIRYSYHNHAVELECLEGDPRTKLDILYEKTDPKSLCAELDVAWLYIGGADPAETIRKYAGRCPVIHVKDTSSKPGTKEPVFTALGRGNLDWEAIFAAAWEAGVEWLVYEQDETEGDIFEDLAESYAFLRRAVPSPSAD